MRASAAAVTLLKRLVPRPVKGAVRRAYEQRTLDDALRHAAVLGETEAPSRRLLEDLQFGWANDGMVARTDYLEEVCRQAQRVSGPVLECGSGLTTLLLGLLAGRRGLDTWSLEHLPEWRERVAAELARHSVPRVQLMLAPLSDFGTFTWYRAPFDIMPNTFHLVVCDGPPSETPGGRYGMLPLMRERLAPEAIILLDDAERASESEVLANWTREDEGLQASVHETSSGTFARVHRPQ